MQENITVLKKSFRLFANSFIIIVNKTVANITNNLNTQIKIIWLSNLDVSLITAIIQQF